MPKWWHYRRCSSASFPQHQEGSCKHGCWYFIYQFYPIHRISLGRFPYVLPIANHSLICWKEHWLIQHSCRWRIDTSQGDPAQTWSEGNSSQQKTWQRKWIRRLWWRWGGFRCISDEEKVRLEQDRWRSYYQAQGQGQRRHQEEREW